MSAPCLAKLVKMGFNGRLRTKSATHWEKLHYFYNFLASMSSTQTSESQLFPFLHIFKNRAADSYGFIRTTSVGMNTYHMAFAIRKSPSRTCPIPGALNPAYIQIAACEMSLFHRPALNH